MAKKRPSILRKDGVKPAQKPKKAPKPKAAPGKAGGASKAPRKRPAPDAVPGQAKRPKYEPGAKPAVAGGAAVPVANTQTVWLPHSVIHRQAAVAVGKLLAADATRSGGVNVKALTLAPHIAEKKATYAVTCNTLRYLPLLMQAVAKAGLLEKYEGKLMPEVAAVLAYEVLLGQGCKKSGPAERALMGAKDVMTRKLQKLLVAAGAQSVEELLPPAPAAHPRAARVNTLKMSVEDALAWIRQPPPEHMKLTALGKRVELDPLLPDVLLFPAGADLHEHPLVQSHCLILQSKASCMPAHALGPPVGWHVVDCCAAPGNKTTHVAALMKGVGRVSAFDMNERRLSRLEGNAQATGATNVVAQQADFLQVDVDDPQYADVAGVILDPSCSGSGTTASRMDYLLPSHREKGTALDEVEIARIEGLAKFQEAALRHALRFPALQRLVYSTCSLHARENEDVVGSVLEYATELGFHLVNHSQCSSSWDQNSTVGEAGEQERARNVWPVIVQLMEVGIHSSALKDPFPSWRRRGQGRVQGAELLVRTDPEEDGTDGFFLAVFQKSKSAGGTMTAPQAKPKVAQRTKAAKSAQKSAQKVAQKGVDPDVATPSEVQEPVIAVEAEAAAISREETAAVATPAVATPAVAAAKRGPLVAKPTAAVAKPAVRGVKEASGVVKPATKIAKPVTGGMKRPAGVVKTPVGPAKVVKSGAGPANVAAGTVKRPVAGVGKAATNGVTSAAAAQSKVVKQVREGAVSKAPLVKATAASTAPAKPKAALKKVAGGKPKPAAWV